MIITRVVLTDNDRFLDELYTKLQGSLGLETIDNLHGATEDLICLSVHNNHKVCYLEHFDIDVSDYYLTQFLIMIESAYVLVGTNDYERVKSVEIILHRNSKNVFSKIADAFFETRELLLSSCQVVIEGHTEVGPSRELLEAGFDDFTFVEQAGSYLHTCEIEHLRRNDSVINLAMGTE